VDLRQSSSSFGTWTGQRLSEKTRQSLWIPPGFAHGFYVISEHAGVFYKTTDSYAPDWERTLLWNDPELGIEWPIPEMIEPIVSAKDANGSLLSETDLFK
jgi:dTDP-4-dehydrorhamnose 3,5-epimerase